MVSLDPELSKLFILLISTSATFGSQNGSTFPNFLKRKLENSFLQHESKIVFDFFPIRKDTSMEKSGFFLLPGAKRKEYPKIKTLDLYSILLHDGVVPLRVRVISTLREIFGFTLLLQHRRNFWLSAPHIVTLLYSSLHVF